MKLQVTKQEIFHAEHLQMTTSLKKWLLVSV